MVKIKTATYLLDDYFGLSHEESLSDWKRSTEKFLLATLTPHETALTAQPLGQVDNR